jgi:septum formation protein
VVAADGEILGKPKNREDARQMISLLQGRTHMVYTGVTLLLCQNGQMENLTFSEGTKVKVAPMSEKEIEDYIDTDEPYDKAGAYGIQGAFSKYIEGIEGDYFNVVGLPVHRVYEEMKKKIPNHSES